MAISVSGLNGGIDFSGLVEQLVQVERRPIATLERRKAAANRRLTAVGDLVTKLKALQTKAKESDSGAELGARTTTTTNDARIRATATSAAEPATWQVTVGNLARAETDRSTSFDEDADGVAGAGSIDITVGDDAPVTVSWSDEDSLTDIAKSINDSAARVRAEVVNDGSGYRLVVTGELGADNAIELAGGAALGMTEVAAAADAQFTLNGVAITRPSNQIADAIAGVTFDLRSPTAVGEEVTVTVAKDPAGTRKKVEELVAAYNDVARVLASQLSFSGTVKGEDSLFGDATVVSLQRSLSGIVAKGYPHGAGTVSGRDVGITIAADGTLVLDGAKLEAKLADDPTAVEHLLAGDGAPALAGALTDLVTLFTASGDGLLSAKQTSIRSRIDSFDDQITRVEDAASRAEDRLRRQFAALDGLMSALQSQMSYLSALFPR